MATGRVEGEAMGDGDMFPLDLEEVVSFVSRSALTIGIVRARMNDLVKMTSCKTKFRSRTTGVPSATLRIIHCIHFPCSSWSDSVVCLLLWSCNS